MKNLFEINLENISIETFQDSTIYKIDNFYRYPDEVLKYIESHQAALWKSWEVPSYNGKHFVDYRHDFIDNRLTEIDHQLENLCNQYISQPCRVVTNKIKFIDYNFNDYFNNFWAPHTDLGYTGLVYFDSSGTNLYEPIDNDHWTEHEHVAPWRPKSKYKIIKTLESKFNRLILFDGAKFLHGMSITDDRYFKKYRFNQAFFLKSKSLDELIR
jgi:hypothetical protein